MIRPLSEASIYENTTCTHEAPEPNISPQFPTLVSASLLPVTIWLISTAPPSSKTTSVRKISWHSHRGPRKVYSIGFGSVDGEVLARRGWHFHVSPRNGLLPSAYSHPSPSWEFFVTLDYELSVIRGHRPYRWPVLVCPRTSSRPRYTGARGPSRGLMLTSK